jgi:hypothetical protein
MPPRWSRKPDRADPEFRKLDDRMTFATHVAIFAAINSGLWFFRVLGSSSELGIPGGVSVTPLITEVWALILAAHALYIFTIAKYTAPTPIADSTPKGFQPKSEKIKEKSSKSTKR